MSRGIYPHKPLSQETKRKMSQSLLGHPTSVETRQKISQSLMGHLTSEETRKRISNRYYPRGLDNPQLKGIKLSSEGYILIYQPDNPRAGDSGYMKYADLTMEQMIGRYLYLDEITHHKNKVRDDDRPENLELFLNKSEHMRFHAKAGDCFPLDGSTGVPFQKGYDSRRFTGN